LQLCEKVLDLRDAFRRLRQSRLRVPERLAFLMLEQDVERQS
jgi:hypothetical protein